MRIIGESGCGSTSLGDLMLIHFSRAVVLAVDLPFPPTLFFLSHFSSFSSFLRFIFKR